MKMNKKNKILRKTTIVSLCLSSFLFSFTMSLSLSSCNQDDPSPREDVSISINNSFKSNFVYKKSTFLKQFASFNFELSNFVGCEEILFEISSQEEQESPTNKLMFENGTTKISFLPTKDMDFIDLMIGPKEDESIDVWPMTYYTFSIIATIKWKSQTLKTFNFDNLQIFVGKPTTREMLDVELDKDEIILNGFSNDPSVQQDISSCDILVIPYDITKIANFAFYKKNQSTIPYSIKHLLLQQNYYVSSNLVSIGTCAFRDAKFDDCLYIPNSVKIIDHYAFANTTFSQLVLSNSVLEINDSAFDGCINFTGDLIIPRNVNHIGSRAFADCHGFDKSLIFEGPVAEVKQAAFKNCFNIRKIDLSQYVYHPQWLITKLNQAFDGWSLVGSAYVPDDTNVWKENLVTNNSLPSTWEIRSSLERNIPEDFFVISDDKTELLGLKEGVDINSYDSIAIPCGITKISDNCFNNVFQLDGPIKKINLFNGVLNRIGKNAFANCEGLCGELAIPSSVVSMGEKCFFGCKNITSITIPSSVSNINNSAFEDCSRVNHIDFHTFSFQPYWLSKENSNIFSGLASIGSINVSDKIDKKLWRSLLIKNTGFNCRQWNVWYEGEVAPNSVFKLSADKKTLEDVINFDKLEGCTTLSIPSSVETIADNAFNHDEIRNSSIKNINLNLPNLKTIGAKAFFNCYNFTCDLLLSNNLTKIGEDAFNGCKNVTTLYLHKDVTSIGNRAFANCLSLVEVHAEDYETVPKWLDGMQTPSHIFQNILTVGSFYFNDNYSSKDTFNSANILVTMCDIPFSWTCCAESRILPESYYILGDDQTTLVSITPPINDDEANKYFWAKLPPSVTVLGEKSFANLNQYKHIRNINLFNGNLQKIDNNGLSFVDTENFIIPPYVEYIGEKAFENSAISYKLYILGAPVIMSKAFYGFFVSEDNPILYLGGYTSVPECFKVENNDMFKFEVREGMQNIGTVYVANNQLKEEFSHYLFGFEGKKYCNLPKEMWQIASLDELWNV